MSHKNAMDENSVSTKTSTSTSKLEIAFSKFHGAQNDFVAIDNRGDGVHMTPEQRKHMCDRHLGIGADGIFEIHRSDVADFKLVHYSSKGMQSGLCGNGSRCAVTFCRRLGLPYRKSMLSEDTDDKGQGHITLSSSSEYREVEQEICKYGFPSNYYVFETSDGIHFGTMSTSSDDQYFIRCCPMDLAGIKVYTNGDVFLNNGSPHHVKFVPSVEEVDAEKTGRVIVNDVYKEVGSHINFVSKKSSRTISETVLRARTYEFTVDYETLACGTGAIAIAIADVIRTMLLESGYAFTSGDGQSDEILSQPSKDILAEVGKLQDANDPERKKTYHRLIEMRGGVLQVHFQMDNEQVHSVWLQGPVVHVMDGSYWQ